MILSCIITHNRLALTKLTVESYLNTTGVDHFLVVVDNASTDGTIDYLKSINEIDCLILSEQNLYPGAACNLGWTKGLELVPEVNFLHRSDNDIFYHMNWDVYSIETFKYIPELGQFGILNLKDQYYPGCDPCSLYQDRINIHYPNVGGNHLTRKNLWDSGLRHIESTWDTDGEEDVKFSHQVGEFGYVFGHTTQQLATHLGIWSGFYNNRDYREYYRRTYLQRLNNDIYPNIPISGEEF